MAKGFRGGMGMGGNMNRVVAQAQKAQRQIELAQAEIREMRFTGTAGGELVKVVVGGDHQLYEVQIAKEVVDPDEEEEIYDYFKNADNDDIKAAMDELGEDYYDIIHVRLVRIKFHCDLGN